MKILYLSILFILLPKIYTKIYSLEYN